MKYTCLLITMTSVVLFSVVCVSNFVTLLERLEESG